MCTLTFAWQVFPDAPVVVAANRDERDDRPSSSPHVFQEGDSPRIVAPRDEEAGGTWIGYNESGVFVAISNRWIASEPRADRSRGLLVMDALKTTSAEEGARAVERELAERSYAGFNLVIADANAAILFEWDGNLQVTNLEPGLHVVMNAGVDDRFVIPTNRAEAAERQAESAQLVSAALQVEPGEAVDSWIDRAAVVLADHDYGVCIHGDGFGTRSSSLITLYEDGRATYRFAPGPPCETAYGEVEAQV